MEISLIGFCTSLPASRLIMSNKTLLTDENSAWFIIYLRTKKRIIFIVYDLNVLDMIYLQFNSCNKFKPISN